MDLRAGAYSFSRVLGEIRTMESHLTLAARLRGRQQLRKIRLAIGCSGVKARSAEGSWRLQG